MSAVWGAVIGGLGEGANGGSHSHPNSSLSGLEEGAQDGRSHSFFCGPGEKTWRMKKRQWRGEGEKKEKDKH